MYKRQILFLLLTVNYNRLHNLSLLAYAYSILVLLYINSLTPLSTLNEPLIIALLVVYAYIVLIRSILRLDSSSRYIEIMLKYNIHIGLPSIVIFTECILTLLTIIVTKVLIMTILLLVYVSFLISYILIVRRESEKIVLEIPETINVYRDDTLKISLKLINTSNKMSFIVKFRISTINSRGVKIEVLNQKKAENIALKRGGEATYNLLIRGLRIGSYENSIVLIVADSKYMYWREKEYRVKIRVLPKVERAIKQVKALLSIFSSSPAIHRLTASGLLRYEVIKTLGESFLRSMLKGDYKGCREYTPGDDIRDIHLKKSLEKGRLITKEYSSGSRSNISILVDISCFSLDSLDNTLYDLIIILLLTLLLGYNRISVIIYDDKMIYARYILMKPIELLGKIIEFIKEVSFKDKLIAMILDKPDIASMTLCRSEYAERHLRMLTIRFKSSILHRLLEDWISKRIDIDRIIILAYDSILKHLYALLNYYLSQIKTSLIIIEDSTSLREYIRDLIIA